MKVADPIVQVVDWTRFAQRVQRLLEPYRASERHAFSFTLMHRGQLAYRWDSTSGHIASSNSVGSRFLVASLTKPVTAAAMMRLVEEGEISLTTPVAKVLPQFSGDGREHIKLWHLLTHTSGLPDMVADNIRLRENHAGLTDFFDELCSAPLQFKPGSGIGYQSMGSLVIAMLIERLTNAPFRDFVSAEILAPAGMTDSSIGLSPQNNEGDVVDVELPTGQRETDWHWNSNYWRTLGAPWGGLITTAQDLVSFLHIFLKQGRSLRGRTVLSPATTTSMCRDWTRKLSNDFPEVGLTWLIRGDDQVLQRDRVPGSIDDAHVTTSAEYVFDRRFFGELTSKNAFGHTGATGCSMWADPDLDVAAVLLTNTPQILQSETLPRISNMVAAAAI